MSHIFISYSRRDVDFARYLRALLEAEGFLVWMDETRLTPGEDWWDMIVANVDSCAAFLVVMSAAGTKSKWVKREILRAEQQERPIFPVLVAGDAWSRLADIQYEDMRAGLQGKLSSDFIKKLRIVALPEVRRSPRNIVLSIEAGDITKFPADVVAFKHAQRFLGSDNVASIRLKAVGIEPRGLRSKPGDYKYIDTQGAIQAKHALFVGVPNLGQFGYKQIREFAVLTLKALTNEAPDTQHLAMTIHGPVAGRDEAEALRSQVAGYLDAMNSGQLPPGLERITIVERAKKRIVRLCAVLEEFLAEADYATPMDRDVYHLHVPGGNSAGTIAPDKLARAKSPETKPHVLAIMPDAGEFEDVFYYGIQGAVHAAGLLCERIESETLADEKMEQIKKRIDNAAIVVAEISEATPLVYLQIGYAWGKNRPTILAANKYASPPAEIGDYVVYDKIHDLESKLAKAIQAIRG